MDLMQRRRAMMVTAAAIQYAGEITVTERRDEFTFFAPGCESFGIYADTKPSTSTGEAFIYGGVGVPGSFYTVTSVNAGNSITGGVNTMILSREQDNFLLKTSGKTSTTSVKTLQPGITYRWVAW